MFHSRADGLSPLGWSLAQIGQAIPHDRVIIACAPEHVVQIARQCPEVPDENIVVEPQPKGSGPVTALVATLLAQRDPGAIVVSAPADNRLADHSDPSRSIRLGVEAARLGWVTSLGLPLSRLDSDHEHIVR